MRKTAALLGSALFFLVAPFTIGFVVPWWIAGWEIGTSTPEGNLFRVTGVMLVILGLVPLVESFGRFALVGLGTPAPVAPTKHLVVTGFYRYVRNPMYVGVLAIILGNALILEDGAVFAYAALIALAFAAFVMAYEEPALRRQFGAEYEAFYRNVPRWIPRLTPWRPAERG
ncbi:MAG TPA: isoprenylcysteine carboxylmethyltransferase family protein [Rhizomicrobium sp.]|nr:isoprenylcysteine carboxylmethyltransferase family protein [Rhizomicrobium sp.]